MNFKRPPTATYFLLRQKFRDHALPTYNVVVLMRDRGHEPMAVGVFYNLMKQK